MKGNMLINSDLWARILSTCSASYHTSLQLIRTQSNVVFVPSHFCVWICCRAIKTDKRLSNIRLLIFLKWQKIQFLSFNFFGWEWGFWSTDPGIFISIVNLAFLFFQQQFHRFTFQSNTKYWESMKDMRQNYISLPNFPTQKHSNCIIFYAPTCHVFAAWTTWSQPKVAADQVSAR